VGQGVGHGWHANHVSSANYSSRLVIDLKRRKRAKSRASEPPRIVRLLAQAEQWQRMLASGEGRTRSEVAKKAGVSANPVTNLLALLKLAPAILDAIPVLPPGTPKRLVTECKLRPLTALPHSEQLQAARRFIPAPVQSRKTA
jgi:hypothetical protein